jgi:hypothetical protein
VRSPVLRSKDSTRDLTAGDSLEQV